MSHLDDLDEYEAELELGLKREYQAVFALFRFCVLTQDATYLCNKLDVGNTQTVFGLYEGEELGERWRIATESQRTGDELGALLGDFLDFDTIDGICLSSTVPRL